MTEKKLNVGVGALTVAFGSLVAILEARGIMPDGELARILDENADEISPGIAEELKELAACLRGRQRPTLTAIDGGKRDK